MPSSLFISDLHLSEERSEANERFFSFMEDTAAEAAALYILGDLFEYWIGDDDLGQPFHALVAGFLKRLAASGVAVHVMHGNRDFLIASAFARAAGASLMPDPTVADIGGTPTLLMHGDTLCQDDADYQAWRSTARSEKWQAEFLERPLEERRAIILGLRRKSRDAIRTKPAEVMDVSAPAVRAAFAAHGVSRLVHGHTHRPGHHRLEVDGRLCERWVLPDWYGRGGYLEIGRGAPKLVRF
ncbi:MAG TPA: UDP-2,3-diacylglucosamine diphosphatase [Burkholderiales bacterium]|nr:UDP-2,3-diacylglucosamine diphosphatase [Burkholderiales bacterium]